MGSLQTIDDRFELHERAGAGGMGVVRRGLDLTTGRSVAVKLLHPGQAAERFLREAELLRTLSHPAIVQYIAHGATKQGRLYIVMDWLDGSTLGELLARRTLSPKEGVTLARRLAGGLGAAHAQGVVHRDIKPSNVILPGDDLERATLIDFGVARRTLDPHLTAVGLLIGTASYMSPEQAGADRDPRPSSDVFSLGSLLYRAVSGQHPFQADDATATLARVLLDEPIRLADVRPGVPPLLDQLVWEMLAKRPEARPADGNALFERLSAIDVEEKATLTSERPRALGSDEQRVVWVVIVGLGATTEEATEEVSLRPELTPLARVATIVTGHDARWDVLADGTGVASFSDAGGDRGERAVRIAHAIHALRPDRAMALGMGLGIVGKRVPVGEALDRAVAALQRSQKGEIHVDPLAAASLDPLVLETTNDGRSLLARAGPRPDENRKLLGRATRCVGRERELISLEALYDECTRDGVARVALVLGPTGIGKSRVRYELLNRLRERGERPEILVGRGDSLSAGSPFALLREALRRSAKILDGEPLAQSRQKLFDRMRRVLGETTRAFDVAVFLGELCNVPFDDADSDALRVARGDPASMGDAIRGAWLDYVDAECADKPLLLLLEDLHWGDLPTVSLVDAALGANRERPFLVVGIARPEIHDALPGAWSKRDVAEIRLNPLPKNACRELVREVLGPELDADLTERVVDLASGNAFFLEELIRAVAEGRTTLPPTVMGVMQARLETLDADARQVLRAGSVFGRRFWRGAVEKLVGETQRVALTLEGLVDRELVTRRPEAAFPGEVEYVFRHSIVRETAYAALTEKDRALGHRMAGAWLMSVGETDALTLAEHFRRGGEPKQAERFFLASAEQALEGHDLGASIERARLALECDPDAPTRGRLAQLRSHAHLWKGEYAEAESAGLEAVDLLVEGSSRWFSALAEVCSSAGALDHADVLGRAANLAANAKAESDDARALQVMCLSRAATGHLRHGRRDTALEVIEKMQAIRREATTLTSTMEAWTFHGRAALAYFSGESAEFRRSLEAAIHAFDIAGDTRAATNDRVNLGFALAALGDYGAAEEIIRQALAHADRLGLAKVSGYARHNLGWIRMQLGAPREAVELQRWVIESAQQQGEAFLEGSARTYLSLALFALGELDAAETEARRAAELLEPAPALRPHALAALARTLSAQHRTEDALTVANEALAAADSLELPEDSDVLVRLVAAEIHHAVGAEAEARSTIDASRDRILERAQRVGDPELERSFLSRVPEHVRTLELARVWQNDD